MNKDECLRCGEMKEIVIINSNARKGRCRECYNKERVKDLPKRKELLKKWKDSGRDGKRLLRMIMELELEIRELEKLKFEFEEKESEGDE